MPHYAIETMLWLLGLCIGSFLNVVIYRWPRGLSVLRPTRSFCPNCRRTIAWHENLPVASWLLQRGRCRGCHTAISAQYPLVESLTGLAFVLVYHLIFDAAARQGLWDPQIPGANAVLPPPADVPLLLAWLVLAAVLIACSAMDLVSYMVDIRLTDIALYAGILCYAVWPRSDFFGTRAAEPASAAAVAAALVAFVMLRRSRTASEEVEPPEDAPEPAPPAPQRAPRIAALAGALLSVFAAGWLILHEHDPGSLSAAQAAPIPVALGLMFFAVVLAGGQARDADNEMRETIEGESSSARRVALAELRWLSGSILAGIAAYCLVAFWPPAGEAWQSAMRWSPARGFAPLGGASFAILGAVVGAAAGWLLRLLFTLVFGREAFGTGDIYILAGAGAAAGWDIALLGLALSVPIALVGWIFTLLLKRSVMIPFGPWLALGFFSALWLNRQAAEVAYDYAEVLRQIWASQPELIWVASGLMLVGFVLAVLLARLVRRLVEPAGS